LCGEYGPTCSGSNLDLKPSEKGESYLAADAKHSKNSKNSKKKKVNPD
jgi:hypothetical protein